MTVSELAKEINLDTSTIHDMIRNHHLPYEMVAIPTRRGDRMMKSLPPESAEFIRRTQKAPAKMRTYGHGLRSPEMRRFFSKLVTTRQEAGKPLNVGVFIDNYRAMY